MERTGAQIVWECLVQRGIRVVFGYPGGANLPIYDALLDYPIHHVLVRHEQSAAHMADGYARASGKVGVALATSGPGATNLVTGIATAFMDSIPVVFITAQVSSPLIGYDAFQEIDVTGITLPITKHNYLVTNVEDIAPTLNEAFEIAKSGRPGPVLVDISKDAQQRTTDWSPEVQPAKRQHRFTKKTTAVSPQSLQTFQQMVKSAKRPLILAGHGVLLSGANEELVKFAEHTGTPVATTLLGLGAIPVQHPLNLGMVGMHGAACVNHAVQDADLIMAFGMRFDDRVTGNLSKFAPDSKKIHVEIDPSEINKNVKVDLAIVSDLRPVLNMVMVGLDTLTHEQWLSEIRANRLEDMARDIQSMSDSGQLFAAHAIQDLWDATDGKALMVTDVGQHQMWAAQYYMPDHPQKFITSGGLGTMGFGLPAAIGAKFARPEEEVWMICGDGGFQMTQAELATIAQEGIKVNIALINNGFLGMVRQWQELFYDQRYAATPLHNPDFIKIAEAHGLAAVSVKTRKEVKEAVAWAREQPGTVLVEFCVEKEDIVYPMVPAGAELREMIRRPISVPWFENVDNGD